MANIFNNDNKLYWVFTTYAINKLSDFSTDENLKLMAIGIGDYDWYTDEKKKLGPTGYSEAAFKAYFQDENIERDLGNPITYENEEGDKDAPRYFSITRKEISEDETNVILSATINETFGGFDIREIGIYDCEYDEDSEKITPKHLFAVCTMQPITKPTTETNHYISTQLICHLFSQRLIDYFDYIEIDSKNNFVTVDDINKYQTNLLFVESNLAEQISRNTQIIGYNRVQQLYELLKNNQDKYSKFGVSSVYSNIANVMEVKNFWTFRPSGYLTRESMLDDLSLNNDNLGTDQLSTLYETGYEGIASWLNFNNVHYYTDTPTQDVYQVTEEVEDITIKNYYVKNGHTDLTFIDLIVNDNNMVIGAQDSPFSIIFVGAQNSNSSDCTLYAKYNTFTEHPGLYVSITKDREVNVSMYTNKNNYINFKTYAGSVPAAGTFYSLIIEYNGDVRNPKVAVNINGSNIATTYTKSTGYIYSGMTVDGIMLPMFSFKRTADGDINGVNSKICLLSVLKGTFDDSYRQSIAYNLMSLIGNNPCLI